MKQDGAGLEGRGMLIRAHVDRKHLQRVSEKRRVSVGKGGREGFPSDRFTCIQGDWAMRVDQQRDGENREPGIGTKREVVDL